VVALPTAVTTPVVALMLAIVGFVTVQVPPGTVFVNVTGAEIHTRFDPLIRLAYGCTVNVRVAVQPDVYTINDMVAVPADTPVTTAVAEPTDAIVASLLLHEPDPGLMSDTVRPSHTPAVPVIADKVLTVMLRVLRQPNDVVNDMLTVPPATPVTIPVAEPTEPISGLLLLHLPPPAVVLVSVIC
jgi:hypothetical protein